MIGVVLVVWHKHKIDTDFLFRARFLFFSITSLFKLHNTTDAITLSAVRLHLLANRIKCARVKTCEYFHIGPRDELETCP